MLNAANEIAVEAFLTERISFPAIPSVIEDTLADCPLHSPASLEDVLALDAEARTLAESHVAGAAL